MSEETNPLPPGWHLDEETGCLVRDTIHRMGRRCRNWNYRGTGCYLVTMALRDRSRPVLGEVHRAIDGAVRFFPTELGRRIEAHLRRLPEFSPEIEVLGAQPMPDHLHAVLRVRRQMPKPLGECLRGFKIGCTKIWRLLLLAPAGWPYLPGEKRMTREDSCVLNRIAQLLCGSGAAEIRYRGLVPAALDRMVEKTMRP